MTELIQLMLNADEHIAHFVTEYGRLTYIIMFLIIFIETGLVVVTFFPGDGLLFSAGILAASGQLNLAAILVLLSLATIAGNTSNYMIGKFLGSRYFKKEKARRNHYLSKAFGYFEKHEGKAVIFSRFFPFLRSFVPFVAGVSEMKFSVFTWGNIIGGILWIATFTVSGFLFGEIPLIRDNYGLVFSIFLLLLLFSMLFGFVQMIVRNIMNKKKKKNRPSTD